jgi:hypothetical protein
MSRSKPSQSHLAGDLRLGRGPLRDRFVEERAERRGPFAMQNTDPQTPCRLSDITNH